MALLRRRHLPAKIIEWGGRSCSTTPRPPFKTALYDYHARNGGKMVNFGGALLPVQYADASVPASHAHTRSACSLFDVSHMLQTRAMGRGCRAWIEHITPLDVGAMSDGSSSLTVFLNAAGGILDDLIVTKIDDEHLYIVSNAGRREHDERHMRQTASGNDVELSFADPAERSLLALQGPTAAKCLQNVCSVELSRVPFMGSRAGTVAGVDNCRITRCGYTGEDGFEISIPSDGVERVCVELMRNDQVKLAGLGARDSLRLEAGLCLYGNDIDETITPIEANLAWLIPKSRRTVTSSKPFLGADVVLRQLAEGVAKRRIGLRIPTGPPARRGAEIKLPGTDKVVGHITSGCPSPTLGGNVAMGYVGDELKKVGTELSIDVRGVTVGCTIAKMPFVPTNYYNPQKGAKK